MTLSGQQIGQRYRELVEDVAVQCASAGRDPSEVTVVAVSKAHPVDAIEAAVEAGCLDFGENRVQEFCAKAPRLPRRIRWHFIGHLQRNKVKHLIDEVTLIHTIDSEHLVEVLERRSGAPQDVLIEVNIGEEPQKSGVSPSEVEALALRCARSPIARPVGLMCIPPYREDPNQVRPFYRKLAALRDEVADAIKGLDELVAREFRHLSMGMTHDYSVAVAEGATIIRVGTQIFGPRQPRGL